MQTGLAVFNSHARLYTYNDLYKISLDMIRKINAIVTTANQRDVMGTVVL